MKTFKFIAIAVLSVVLGHEVMAQGNINIINGGTNLNVAGAFDTTNTPIIAQYYIGGRIVYPASGGSNIIVTGYTVNNAAGGASGSNTLVNIIPHTSGYRTSAFVSNLSVVPGSGGNADIGVKLGFYPTNGIPDYVIPAGGSRQLYFGGGYNGLISARALSTNVMLSIIYSETGNSPGQ